METPTNEQPNSTAPANDRHRLVAVPDPSANPQLVKPLYRLGIKGSSHGESLQIGEDGPAGQRLPWVYLTAGESLRYELDLDAARISVFITDPASGDVRVVSFDIDVQAMEGQRIAVGQPVTIVFAYDGRATFDITPEIDEWCATTGPRYTEELLARLQQIDNSVVEIEEARARAQALGSVRHATRPPKTARSAKVEQTAEHDELPDAAIPHTAGTDIEFDATLPEGVQIYDPVSGKTFVGRRWARPHEQTTLQALVEGGYKLAVVRFRNGDIATLMPNFSGRKMAIQIKNGKGTIGRVLDESANGAPLGPGHRIYAEMSHTTSGDPSVRGQMLTTPPIVLVVGIGPEAKEANLPYPPDNTLAEFRRSDSLEKNTPGNLQHNLRAG